MKELNFYPLMGLFAELYAPDINSLSLDPLVPSGRWSLQRANGLFWAQHLRVSEVEFLIEQLEIKYQRKECGIRQYQAILDNPRLFIEQVIQAPKTLINQAISPQVFFLQSKL